MGHFYCNVSSIGESWRPRRSVRGLGSIGFLRNQRTSVSVKIGPGAKIYGAPLEVWRCHSVFSPKEQVLRGPRKCPWRGRRKPLLPAPPGSIIQRFLLKFQTKCVFDGLKGKERPSMPMPSFIRLELDRSETRFIGGGRWPERVHPFCKSCYFSSSSSESDSFCDPPTPPSRVFLF
jgi:hypothetical protein